MNKFVLIAAVATLSFAGCAAYHGPTQYDDVDTQKVAAIDRVLRSHGIEVHWVNYPQRKGIVSDPGAPTGT